MNRKYELKRRAEQQDETRRRIIRAALELHGSVGFVDATVKAVAERAGVQRLTVYRHFPSERDLVGACAVHFFTTHPFPDLSEWRRIADPEKRLRVALLAVYEWFRETERSMANFIRDASAKPFLFELGEPLFAHWEAMRAQLARGWGVRGRRRKLLEAAVGHALDFQAWRSLSQRGLTDEDVADLMTRFVACVKN